VNIVGSRSKDLLLFEERWKRISEEVVFTTDDGSIGMKGLVTEPLMELLGDMNNTERKKTTVFSCGPEVMLSAVKDVLDKHNVGGQFSLERFMKCGVGICDSCSISGKRVCMDGPVFTLDRLDQMEEFGRIHRDRAGRPVSLKECVR
jgi:dihydroorotate dehydrogenase electron transfer subunit